MTENETLILRKVALFYLFQSLTGGESRKHCIIKLKN